MIELWKGKGDGNVRSGDRRNGTFSFDLFHKLVRWHLKRYLLHDQIEKISEMMIRMMIEEEEGDLQLLVRHISDDVSSMNLK
jgi:hypothetical protein